MLKNEKNYYENGKVSNLKRRIKNSYVFFEISKVLIIKTTWIDERKMIQAMQLYWTLFM